MHQVFKLLVAIFIVVLLYFVIDAKFKHMTSKWTLNEKRQESNRWPYSPLIRAH